MSILSYRNCPNCYYDKPEILFKLRFDQFIRENPTHNIKWFNNLGFEDEHEFLFVKCAKCNFVYSQSRLNDDLHYQFYHLGINSTKSYRKIFSAKKKIRHAKIWINLLSHFSYCSDLIFDLYKRPLKVLDFGAGWGDFLASIKSPGVKTYGLEFDNDKIDYADSIDISIGNLDFIKDNAPYDIFICDQVLEHLDDPKKSLHDLTYLLNSPSVGYISVPDFNQKRLEKHIRIIKQGKPIIKEINPWGHLNYFTPVSLREMLFNEGFQEILPYYELVQKPDTTRYRTPFLNAFNAFLKYQFRAFSVLIDQIYPIKKISTSLYVKK